MSIIASKSQRPSVGTATTPVGPLMRAQVLKAFGGPENFELRDIPTLQVKPGTVLIRVFATSVNQTNHYLKFSSM